MKLTNDLDIDFFRLTSILLHKHTQCKNEHSDQYEKENYSDYERSLKVKKKSLLIY